VRDLQWKCFTPVFMSMSGWAFNNKNKIVDKQPWLFGEPFTSINRKYLMFKERMTPYMYTLCNEAHQTGVPAVRGLVLEYPNDPITWSDAVKYEYLLGKNLLVAPVYKSEAERDSIYLPAGNWIDYWDGKEYAGNQTLRHYPAPLDKLPLFVRSGAIIPMYQQMMYDKQQAIDTLTLDIYPAGKSSFTLYEDDGDTQEYRKGRFATTTFEVNAADDATRFTTIVLNASKGDYDGKEKQRAYLLDLHTSAIPSVVIIQGQKLKRQKAATAFATASSGWYCSTEGEKTILHIKTPFISTSTTATIEIK